MNTKVLQAAFGGLVHDIGKPMQRSVCRSDLSDEELAFVPFNKTKNSYTHLHAGYTSRFLKQKMKMFDEFEAQISGHHISDSREFATWIREADRIASAIDRKDNKGDDEQKGSKNFRQVRLSSIFGEVDFGKPIEDGWFDLTTLSDFEKPNLKSARIPEFDEAVEEYELLMAQFYTEVSQDNLLKRGITKNAFDRLYALFNEYFSTTPASTFEKGQTHVSLFDHLKLTAAIASCMAAGKQDSFRILEFDISGIQKFIFKVVEGTDQKQQVAKSLRGRSLMISVLTDMITTSYLHEFGLTQANILFNTGGGAQLLLPDVDDFDEKVDKVSKSLLKAIFERFGTDITFVYQSVILSAEELKRFKAEKAVDLKAQLEDAKARKYLPVINDPAFWKKEGTTKTCRLCGGMSNTDECETCSTIIRMSEYLVKHENPVFMFFFSAPKKHPKTDYVELRLGECRVWMIDRNQAQEYIDECEYLESVNTPWMGVTRYIASDIPLNKNGEIIPLDEICSDLIDSSKWGDPKLGILKMDVDNLGAIFAYGMDSNTRSLSKYLTLSRFLEVFFGKVLADICREVSMEINPFIVEETCNGTMFYINYAGGDDLVILGPVAGILFLSQRINLALEKITKNKNITISGGIWIQNPHEPVRFGIQNAERMLECSKNLDSKNGMSLLDTTISFEQFNSIMKNVEYWIESVRNGKYSRTGFYSLMKLISTDSKYEYARRLPIALYTLKRNAKNEKFRDELCRRLSEILPVKNTDDDFIDRLSILRLEMKLAIMQTRDGAARDIREAYAAE